MNTENKPKAKRKLKDINFQAEGAHIALVSKEQGGGANNCNYALVMKSTNFSEEFITKMQQVKVTMELPDFLQKFFYVYGSDAKVLATMMGYKEPADTAAMESDEAQKEMQDWIEERMSSFEIVKALHEAESLPEALSKLTENEFLAVRKDQKLVEKSLLKIEKAANKESDNLKGKSETSTDASVEKATKGKNVEPSGSKSKNKEKQMDDDVEVVEKSVLVSVQKQLDDNVVELQKAKDQLAVLEKEKKESLQKAKFDKVLAAVKDETKATLLFKALGLVQDETEFEAVVTALAEMQSVVEKSALFSEKGATLEEEAAPSISPIAKIIKAKFQK